MTRLTAMDFADYDRSHPEVWAHFRRFALELVGAGRRNFGAKAILERIRWYVAVELKAGEFKCNNDYAAFYARRFMELYPEYLGFFRRRRSVADQAYPPEMLLTLAKRRLPMYSSISVESSNKGLDSPGPRD